MMPRTVLVMDFALSAAAGCSMRVPACNRHGLDAGGFQWWVQTMRTDFEHWTRLQVSLLGLGVGICFVLVVGVIMYFGLSDVKPLPGLPPASHKPAAAAHKDAERKKYEKPMFIDMSIKAQKPKG
jgi:hypothetical protein